MKKFILLVLAFFMAPNEVFAEKVAYLQLSSGFWQAWTMNSDGSNKQQITDSLGDKTRLSWFPDGHHLLVNSANGELYKVSVFDKVQEQVDLKLNGVLDATLSPDGEQIVFSLSTGDSIDNNNIWLANIEDGSSKLLTHMPRLQHDPIWSVDGKVIYFLSGRGGQSHDIWRVDLSTGSTEQLTVNQLYHFDIATSPNGYLAFSSNRSGNYEIWLWDQVNEPQKLTSHQALDARPSWSSDTRTIFFESTRDGRQGVWSLDLVDMSMTALTEENALARYPVAYQGSKSW